MGNPIAPDFAVDDRNPAQRVVEYDELGTARPAIDERESYVLLREIRDEIRALREFVMEALG